MQMNKKTKPKSGGRVLHTSAGRMMGPKMPIMPQKITRKMKSVKEEPPEISNNNEYEPEEKEADVLIL